MALFKFAVAMALGTAAFGQETVPYRVALPSDTIELPPLEGDLDGRHVKVRVKSHIPAGASHEFIEKRMQDMERIAHEIFSDDGGLGHVFSNVLPTVLSGIDSVTLPNHRYHRNVHHRGGALSFTCRNDIKRLCKNVDISNLRFPTSTTISNIHKCLSTAGAEVSGACQKKIERTQILSSCGSEIAEVCPDIPVGEGRIHRCLLQNQKALSKKCVDYMISQHYRVNKGLGKFNQAANTRADVSSHNSSHSTKNVVVIVVGVILALAGLFALYSSRKRLYECCKGRNANYNLAGQSGAPLADEDGLGYAPMDSIYEDDGVDGEENEIMASI